MATPVQTISSRYSTLERVMETKALAIGGKSMRKAFFQHLQRMREKVSYSKAKDDSWLTLEYSPKKSMGSALDPSALGWRISSPGTIFVSYGVSRYISKLVLHWR